MYVNVCVRPSKKPLPKWHSKISFIIVVKTFNVHYMHFKCINESCAFGSQFHLWTAIKNVLSNSFQVLMEFFRRLNSKMCIGTPNSVDDKKTSFDAFRFFSKHWMFKFHQQTNKQKIQKRRKEKNTNKKQRISIWEIVIKRIQNGTIS